MCQRRDHGARGSGETAKHGTIVRFGSRADQVAVKIAAGLTSSQTYQYIGIDYPAEGVPAWYQTPVKAKPYVASMLKGAAKVEAEVRAKVASCPGSRIVLIGYSQGAFAVHYALWRLGDDVRFARAIRSVILLADPLNQGGTTRQRIIDVKGSGYAATDVKGMAGITYRVSDVARLMGLPGGKAQSILLDNVTSPILVDHTRTLSVCNPQDVVCTRGASGDAHSNSYSANTVNGFKNSVPADASAFALATLRAANGNGVCDVGEFCAYDDTGHKTLIMDWSANAARTSIDIFNISVANNKVSSVWNRTSATWTGVDEKVNGGDLKLKIPAGAKTNLADVVKKQYFRGTWSDKIDHFDVQK